jgi:hypothetical protein
MSAINATSIALITEWNLSPKHKSVLSSYRLLYWNYRYLLSQIHTSKSGVRLLHRDSTVYEVLYHNCTHEDCLNSTTGQVALSFRKTVDSCIYPNVVLISTPTTTLP